MYCPECGAEYRHDFTTCSDCQVPLVETRLTAPQADADLDPEPIPAAPQPDAGLELVPVFETTDRIVIAMATGLLEDSGIPFYMKGEDITLRMQTPFPWCRIQVPSDREAEARALLQPLEEADSTGAPDLNA